MVAGRLGVAGVGTAIDDRGKTGDWVFSALSFWEGGVGLESMLDSESDSGSGVKLLGAVILPVLVTVVLVGVLTIGTVLGTGVYVSSLLSAPRGGMGTGMACRVGQSQVEAPDGSGGSVTFSQEQLNNAATIIAAGNTAGVGAQGQKVALMTALQESTLRNLANPGVAGSMDLPHEGTGIDHDSAGLFQQRASMGWGSVEEIMTPSKSASVFYDRLKGVEGWESMPPGQAAQSVQRSATPTAYDKWEPTAGALMAALAGVKCEPLGASSGQAAMGVAGVSGGRAAIIAYAQAQVGKAYVWAAEGPSAFDCSGLTKMAYAQAGIQLEHSSGAQLNAGEHIPASQAQPGDLLWWPGHIAIYTGNGRMIGAQTPAEGVREMAVYGSPTYIRVPGL